VTRGVSPIDRRRVEIQFAHKPSIPDPRIALDCDRRMRSRVAFLVGEWVPLLADFVAKVVGGFPEE
jgi:hypothetical protein